ncbi:hypothetical protein [Persicobacter diffluens]|uniref:Uncharacterized protein n=1 Tax=Persicobacter diffluens TaxID=981 RepID=A0AAN5AL52_9BACT|nr:hypothetical protein PEDI_34410 [Persicobacter diffluens]
MKTKIKKLTSKTKDKQVSAKANRRKHRQKIHRQAPKIDHHNFEVKEEKCKMAKTFFGEKVKNHSYYSAIMTLALILYSETNMSLRDIETVLHLFIQQMKINTKSPDHSTVDYWVKKAGIKAIKTFDEKEACVLIYDESITFNGKKLFLVLAVPLSFSEQQEPLRFEDCHLVYLGAKKGWTGEIIHNELAPIVSNMHVQYILSDKGSNLIKAAELLCIPHIFDVTHEVARTLKNLYEKDESYLNFIHWVGDIRKLLACGDYADLAPPKVRSHCRFHQIGEYLKWVETIVHKLDHIAMNTRGAVQNLMNVHVHKDFISDLKAITPMIKGVLKICRSEGITTKSISKMNNLLTEVIREKPKKFANQIYQYLLDMRKKYEGDIPFCCSAIIESVFGKYKSKMSKHPKKMFTNHMLTIPLFFIKENEINELIHQFSTVKVEDIKRPDAVEQAMQRELLVA